jgi:hypothetical protein
MSKRLMHVSVTVLCLALAYHLGARSVGATGASPRYLLFLPEVEVNGKVFELDYSGWVETTAELPPVPVSSLAAFSSANGRAITDKGEGWVRVSGVWESRGFVPGGPTPVKQESWGELKRRYR